MVLRSRSGLSGAPLHQRSAIQKNRRSGALRPFSKSPFITAPIVGFAASASARSVGDRRSGPELTALRKRIDQRSTDRDDTYRDGPQAGSFPRPEEPRRTVSRRQALQQAAEFTARSLPSSCCVRFTSPPVICKRIATPRTGEFWVLRGRLCDQWKPLVVTPLPDKKVPVCPLDVGIIRGKRGGPFEGFLGSCCVVIPAFLRVPGRATASSCLATARLRA